jgi:GNAT superfamily N-acetyltransferase
MDFAGAVDGYSIQRSTPSVEDHLRLRRVGGLSEFSREAVEQGLPGTIFSVLVKHEGVAVGMGRIVGDGGCFFQVVDIVVAPEHQGRGLGKLIMSELMGFAGRELPESAFVSLMADVPADRLYEQFGFTRTAPRSVGMSLRIRRP